MIGTDKNPGILDWITKVMFSQPEAINRLVTQGRYFVPLGTALGLSPKQIIELLALMGQTGFLQGKGGTSIANTLFGAINAAQLTGFGQRQRVAALHELGILSPTGRNVVLTPTGKLDWSKFQTVMTSASTRFPEATFVRDLHNAFNQQASYFLTVLNSPAVRQQMQFINKAFSRLGDVDDVFKKLMDGILINQVSRALTTFKNLLIDIAQPLLPALTQGFSNLADALTVVDTFLRQHTNVAKAIGIGVVGVAVGGFGVAALNVVRLFNVLKEIKGLEALRVGFTGGGILDILGITAVGSVLGKIFPMFKGIGGAFAALAGIFQSGFIGNALRIVGMVLLRLIPVVGWATLIVAGVSGIAYVLSHLAEILNWWQEHKA